MLKPPGAVNVVCGFKEPCFVDGEEAWGHYGCVMCLHLTEKFNEPENTSICGITNEEVNTYFSETEYYELVDN